MSAYHFPTFCTISLTACSSSVRLDSCALPVESIVRGTLKFWLTRRPASLQATAQGLAGRASGDAARRTQDSSSERHCVDVVVSMSK